LRSAGFALPNLPRLASTLEHGKGHEKWASKPLYSPKKTALYW